jgi:hypothetical protein
VDLSGLQEEDREPAYVLVLSVKPVLKCLKEVLWNYSSYKWIN